MKGQNFWHKKGIPMKKRLAAFLQDQSGAMAVFGAVALTVFLGFVVLTVDIGHLTTVRNELQRTADAVALAAVRGLYPDNLETANPNSVTFIDTGKAIARATATLTGNAADGQILTISDVSIKLGIYNHAQKIFTEEYSQNTNAALVEITDRQVNHYFGSLFGKDNSLVSVRALAVMDYAKGLPPGTMPIAIGKDYIDQLDGTTPIKFAPDKTDDAGWFAIGKVNNNIITDYIVNDSCPAIEIGNEIELLNGKADACDDLADKFSLIKSTTNATHWDVCLPVVDTIKFNQDIPIDSFLMFRISEINTQAKTVLGKVIAVGLASPGAKAGGPKGGLLIPPKLVGY